MRILHVSYLTHELKSPKPNEGNTVFFLFKIGFIRQFNINQEHSILYNISIPLLYDLSFVLKLASLSAITSSFENTYLIISQCSILDKTRITPLFVIFIRYIENYHKYTFCSNMNETLSIERSIDDI